MLRALRRFLIVHKPVAAPFNIFKENSARTGTKRARA
jgi:hypothetical protein